MISICADLLLQRMGEAGIAALGKPLNRGLYECIRLAILDGALAPETRLPPSRDLAAELKVSRNTVVYAYEQLLAEGYVHARIGSGTFVAATAPDLALNSGHAGIAGNTEHAVPVLSERGRKLVAQAFASPVQWGAFMPGIPDVTRFPHRRYASIVSRLWRNPDPRMLSYAHGGGYPALRLAIAEHLRVARSVRCEPEQIVVTEGIHQAIDLVSRLLGEPGATAWMEDPGYWGMRHVLQMNQINIVPLPVDEEGLCIPAADALPPPRFIFVTPSHQYPLGIVMSLARRRTLLEYARQHGAWIVEDDYDSEFRFAGLPIPSLQGLQPDAPVIYIGTFSKTLYPGLRLGYMVLPRALSASFQTGHAELYREGHLMTQAALAEFMQSGDYASHIRRMRLLYGKRRALLTGLIQRHLGEEWLNASGSNAGLHLVLRLPDNVNDVALAELALTRGVVVRPLSRYFSTHPAPSGLLLGYASVPEARIEAAFVTLLQCLADVGCKIGR